MDLGASAIALSPHDEPHVATWAAPTKMRTIEFTADLLHAAGAPVDRTFMLVDHRDARVVMIKRYCDLLWSLDPDTMAANLPRASEYLASIVVDTLSRPAERESGLARDFARHRAITALIAREFADPAFGIADAARRLNLSPRIVAGTMAASGHTFHRTLKEARLDAVAEQIVGTQQRISDCALACGFSDISYFNREFRKRFGMSPRAYRAARTCKD